jgi:carbon-monoxide dehydrogenase large subunit
VALRFDKNGHIAIQLGTQSSGQDHAGPLIKLVADATGAEASKISVVEGDTAALEQGGGTGGSKSTLTGTAAAEKMLEELQTRAISLFAKVKQTQPDMVSFQNGLLWVEGGDKPMSVAQLAAAYPGKLDMGATASIKHGSFANGCHACEVEIDRETGEVAVVSYTAVNDFGTILNREVVEGQVHGGIAQGIGQALMESHQFNQTNADILTGSWREYALPRAAYVPSIACFDNGVPCATNSIGLKACGESGATAAPPVVMNAIIDALRQFKGAESLQMPARPSDVWKVMANRA